MSEATALDRRQWLVAAGAASLASISTARGHSAKDAFPVAHITDVHITPDRNAPAGVAQLFQHMFAQPDWSPKLVLNSGDSVMGIDGGVSGASAAKQIGVWKEAVRACKVPIYSSLGNHDVWGGKEPTADVPAEKKGFDLMVGVLGMPAPYYSFDAGGWHFISLNAMCNWPNYGTLTKEHFDWLAEELKKTPASTPICIIGHLPILSVTSLVYGSIRKGNDNVVPGIWQHADCWPITELFKRHPNVKLCLSGHMHTCDRCEYRGVWYICGGAASGSWWNGSEHGFPPLYGKLHLYPDGAFTYDFVDYGWVAKK